MVSEYDRQAKEFLDKFSLKVRVTEYPEDAQDPPKWSIPDKPIKTKVGPMTHGLRYRVTIWHEGKPGRLAFDFWGSIAAREKLEYAKALEERLVLPNVKPSAYDILACVSSDSTYADTFADFCGDMGCNPDSITDRKFFKRCRKFADRIVAFFSPEELDALREIQ